MQLNDGPCLEVLDLPHPDAHLFVARNLSEAGIPFYWRVETDPSLLLVAYRLRSGTYEEVVTVDLAGSVPVAWGKATIDLDVIRGAG